MHYENPDRDSGKQNIICLFKRMLTQNIKPKNLISKYSKDVKEDSGLRLYTTTNYREIEFGIFTVMFSQLYFVFTIISINLFLLTGGYIFRCVWNYITT